MKITETEEWKQLLELKDGWMEDGTGYAPPKEGMEWLGKQLDEHLGGCSLPLPAISPTAYGGVALVWQFGNYRVSLAIDVLRREGIATFQSPCGVEKARFLNLDSRYAWLSIVKTLCGILRDMQEGESNENQT